LRHHQVLPPGGYLSQLDWLRTFRPSVIEEDDGTLRMWYSGHDGERSRILEAVQEPGQRWRRVSLSIDPPVGRPGADVDSVHSPSVIRTGSGYLMAYARSGSRPDRLHLATSDDGHEWEPRCAITPHADGAAIRATHPCLVPDGAGWRLYYAGYDGSGDGRHAAIMAAASTSPVPSPSAPASADGTAWEHLGTVLAPEPSEVALSAPSVLVRQRVFTMVYVRDDGERTVLDVATSTDGLTWDRRGTTLAQGPQAQAPVRLHSPSALHLQGGGLRLWYSTHTDADEADGYRMWSTDFVKPPPPQRRPEVEGVEAVEALTPAGE
jgi:hypothetical protein